VKEKLLAAVRHGIKHVLLPEGNQGDWLDAPEEVRQKLQAHFLHHISDALELTLEKKEK
jgi:ATP-dependent Lon protease